MDRGKNGKWLGKERDGADVTRKVNGVCIFHNDADFPGGLGCAFHIAALEAGERPMDWKPDVCWQVPLRLEEFTEDDGHVVSFVREWKRRDWGEGGHDFHWWCTDDSKAFVGKNPVYEYLKDELTELVGPAIYKMIVDTLSRDTSVALPHPKMKKPKN